MQLTYSHVLKPALIMACSLYLLACGPQEIGQTVQVDAPKNNSNNNSSQNNTGSGNQSNNTHSGSGTQSNNSNTNSGSGNQTNNSSTTVNTNSGSGTQTNTNINNTNAGNGTLVNTVTTGDNTQTNVNTGSGQQTNVAGDQVNIVNNNYLAPPRDQVIEAVKRILSEVPGSEREEIVKYTSSWSSVAGATKYKVYLDQQLYQTVTSPQVEISPDKVGTTTQISVVAANDTQESEPTPGSDLIPKTSLSGTVYDENGSPLGNITVRARSLNSSVAFEASVTTVNGLYSINQAPAGVQLEFIAMRSGFTTRRSVNLLQTNMNQLNFNGILALSDKPEIISANPARNASGLAASTGFVFTFSEPMNRSSVENNFVVQANSNSSFAVAGNSVFSPGNTVWDISDFNTSWNPDHTELTLSFNNGKQLPADKTNTMSYRISFKNEIQDNGGMSRSQKFFKLTSGEAEDSYSFSIRTDDVKPGLSSISALTSENGSLGGDSLKVKLNEAMLVSTKSADLVGGLNGDTSQSPLSASNYFITVTRSGETIANHISWAELGGRVVFDSDDPSRRTLLLLPSSGNADIFTPGDVVKLDMASSVVDPAGNTMNPGQTSRSTNAN